MSTNTQATPAVADRRATMNGKPVYEVASKTVINFDSRFDKKLLCDGITYTTGQACAYSCAFCYVPAMQLKAMERFEKQGVVYPEVESTPHPQPLSPIEAERVAPSKDRIAQHFGVVIRNKDALAVARRQLLSKPEAFRRQKLVIYASPKVDVAANMELVRETVEMCQLILELTNWDIRLLSKSNLLPKVAEMIGVTGEPGGPEHRIIYGVSTGTLDDKLAAAFEEKAPLVSKRIESLHWLQDNGFRTFGMICPSLPLEHDYDYEHWAIRMHNTIRADLCEHVWAEVINLRGDSFTKTMAALTSGGFTKEAELLRGVSTDKEAWEKYARLTFEGHCRAQKFSRTPKLRFLQYVTKDTRAWWEARKEQGAVVL